jgi:hypothetical protein
MRFDQRFKRDAIKKFVDEQCWAGSYPQLTALGTYLADIFEDAMANDVGYIAGIGGSCPPSSLCETWINRYIADRPHITGAAATVPLYLLYGGKDDSIPPNRMRCGLDRLAGDAVNMQVCYEPGLDHQGIVDQGADRVADWIANLALGGPAPAACAAGAEGIVEQCASIPPND